MIAFYLRHKLVINLLVVLVFYILIISCGVEGGVDRPSEPCVGSGC